MQEYCLRLLEILKLLVHLEGLRFLELPRIPGLLEVQQLPELLLILVLLESL